MANEENIHRYPCSACGANLVFDPKVGKLACGYCGHSESIFVNQDTSIDERPFEEYLRPSAAQMQTLATDALEVKCNSCGATVTFVPPETARECDFLRGQNCDAAKICRPFGCARRRAAVCH